jgi:hypothetical protein
MRACLRVQLELSSSTFEELASEQVAVSLEADLMHHHAHRRNGSTDVAPATGKYTCALDFVLGPQF